MKKLLLDFLKKLFVSLVTSYPPFRNWFAKILATELFDKLAAPVILLAIRKGQKVNDIRIGKERYVRLSAYKDQGDWDGVGKSLDDIFS